MHRPSRPAQALAELRLPLLVSLLVPLLQACQYTPGARTTDPGSLPLVFAPEIQAYPAGVIPGLQLRRYPSSEDTVYFRVAANLTDRGDWGEHDDESGSGFGGGIGWRRSLAGIPGGTGWLYGARVDLWSLEIDWRDPGPREGTTDVLVLQPTVEAGYGWSLASGSRLELMVGLGAEFNIDTEGEDVGEGVIALLGLTYVP